MKVLAYDRDPIRFEFQIPEMVGWQIVDESSQYCMEKFLREKGEMSQQPFSDFNYSLRGDTKGSHISCAKTKVLPTC